MTDAREIAREIISGARAVPDGFIRADVAIDAIEAALTAQYKAGQEDMRDRCWQIANFEKGSDAVRISWAIAALPIEDK